eukprot:TRINITY_DN7018_c0_g1_i1.p1 TRINITY_DN7018_c0_g1~~TRINITY_DN7018_c0_g1_i1.p1  ORF type:complete len:144 (-),score=18.17 TRINITY_DN7018_c0_g1_i1:90-464(-)
MATGGLSFRVESHSSLLGHTVHLEILGHTFSMINLWDGYSDWPAWIKETHLDGAPIQWDSRPNEHYPESVGHSEELATAGRAVVTQYCEENGLNVSKAGFGAAVIALGVGEQFVDMLCDALHIQ